MHSEGPQPDPTPESGPETRRLEARIAELEAELEVARAGLLQAEQRITRTERELWQTLLLIGSAPIPVVMFDPEGRVTDMNHEAERYGGRRREELIGRRIDAFLGEKESLQWEDAFASCLDGKVVRGVERSLFPHRGDAKAVLYPLRSESGDLLGVALAEDIQEMRDSRTTLEAINEELKQLAAEDPLTGLANRRSYDSAARREFGRAMRSRSWVSLLMIDIDHFKRFNDERGHGAGDDCLKRVSGALRSCLRRSSDLLARFGGEEFIALLPETELAGARAVAGAMRIAVEDLGIEHADGSVVTCSIGVASVRVIGGTSPRLVQNAADQALYRAKHLGRNRVQTAMPESDAREVIDPGVDGASA